MEKLEIPLTTAQELKINNFFMKYPKLLIGEHYVHTRSPLDNLKHYIWEELSEPEHFGLLDVYHKNLMLSDIDIEIWIQQELVEFLKRERMYPSYFR